MNSTAIPGNKSEYVFRSRLSLNTFDPRCDESIREKPPVITKATQNRLLRETVQNLQRLGFSSCSITNSQLNDTKTFSLCFTYAYNQMDPFYKIGKRWDEEMLRILKFFRYPYPLKRNDLYELLNGPMWPHVLNALHWVICMAMYSTSFALDTSFFEEYEPEMEVIAKCKWDYIFDSLNPHTKLNAQKNLENELVTIEQGFQHEIDPRNLETALLEVREKIAQNEHHKSENEQIEKKISLFNSQIAKIEERSNAMTNLIKIFRDKSNKLNEEISAELVNKQRLKTRLNEISNIVKNQAIDTASVMSLNNQMQLSKKRIIELTNNCESLKDEQSKLDTDVRRIKFQVQDALSNLSKRINLIKSEFDACDLDLSLFKNFNFTSDIWQREEAAIDFKDIVNNIKRSLYESINKVFFDKSQLEKDNCEKNVDLISLSDQKQDILQRVVEIDNKYKLSEINAKEMLSDATYNKEDSILKLSNDKWNTKKEITERETEIRLIESKLNHKRKIHEKNNLEVNQNFDDMLKTLHNNIKNLKANLHQNGQQATIFYDNIQEVLKAYNADI